MVYFLTAGNELSDISITVFVIQAGFEVLTASILACNEMQFGEIPTFRSKILPPFSGM
jgi:hypothetical protein